jgi:hypothetical protein
VLLLVGLSAPGTAVAHGAAHHRAHEQAHHEQAHPHGAPSRHSGELSHAVPSRDVPATAALAITNADDQGDHGHPRVDVGRQSRVGDLGATLHAASLSIPLAAVVALRASPSLMLAARVRADPPTGPPPRLRAPPLP